MIRKYARKKVTTNVIPSGSEQKKTEFLTHF